MEASNLLCKDAGEEVGDPGGNKMAREGGRARWRSRGFYTGGGGGSSCEELLEVPN